MRKDSARRLAKFLAEPNVLHRDLIRQLCRISCVVAALSGDQRPAGHGTEFACDEKVQKKFLTPDT